MIDTVLFSFLPRTERFISRLDLLKKTPRSGVGLLPAVTSLADLEKLVDACPRCRAEKNPLKHVFGNGRREAPDYCFVLINPTHSNLSTGPMYEGPRFPFIGVKRFWKVLNRAGFVTDAAMAAIDASPWDSETTTVVLDELRRRRVYLTNLVKCAQPHPDVPSRRVFEDDFPLFSKEMSLVQPRYIVAFGQLTFSILTNKKIRLNEYFDSVMAGAELWIEPSRDMNGTAFPVMPNFFPVGRGNPARAVQMLRIIEQSPPPSVAI